VPDARQLMPPSINKARSGALLVTFLIPFICSFIGLGSHGALALDSLSSLIDAGNV